MVFLYVLIFIACSIFLGLSSKWLVESLSRIAKFLKWKEFVVAFFLIAISASIPNFIIGIISALNKIPELSLGDIIGGNILDLSLIVGISSLISKMGLSAPSKTVQGSVLFLILVTFLLFFSMIDGNISRIDGILLIGQFLGYVFWLFAKEERFKKAYDNIEKEISFKIFLKSIFLFFFSSILILLSAQGVVASAKFFGKYLNLNLGWIGMLIVAFGNALPEASFSIQCALRGQDWLILGNLIGSVVVCSTLVLGIVAIIHPIEIFNLAAISVGRIFLIISALFFFFALRTEKKITKKEALFLILLYFIFLLVEILIK